MVLTALGSCAVVVGALFLGGAVAGSYVGATLALRRSSDGAGSMGWSR